MDVSRSAAPIHLEKGGVLFSNEKFYASFFAKTRLFEIAS